MHKIGNWFRSAWLVLGVAAIVIILDQWTKSLVRQNIPKFDYIIPFDVLGEYFVFQHVDNYGAAFGILQGGGNFFLIAAIVVVVAILVYVGTIPQDQKLVRVLLGLQMGGAIGNVLDRINQGYVTDFIRMGVPDLYFWPHYNIADAAIMIGVFGLGAYIIVDDIRTQRAQREAEAAAESGQRVNEA